MLLSGALFALFMMGFWLYCLTDAVLTPAAECRGMSKPAWIAVITLTFIGGAIAWLIVRAPVRDPSAPLAARRRDRPGATVTPLSRRAMDGRGRRPSASSRRTGPGRRHRPGHAEGARMTTRSSSERSTARSAVTPQAGEEV